MRVRDVDLGEDVVERPQVRDGTPAVHEDYQCSLAANEIDKELEEGVYRKGLCFRASD